MVCRHLVAQRRAIPRPTDRRSAAMSVYREHALICVKQLQELLQAGVLSEEDEETISAETQILLERIGIVPKDIQWKPFRCFDLDNE